MEPITIHLSGLNRDFIDDLIASGRFTSEDAVIAEALNSYRAHDCGRQHDLTWLKGQLAVGVEQLDRGESSPFVLEAFLKEARELSVKTTA